MCIRDRPRTLAEWKKRATSLKNSGRKVEAWSAFKFIEKQEQDSPVWSRNNGINFGWKARQYDYLVKQYSKRHYEKPDAQTAWRAMASAWRAGAWDGVYHWLKLGDVAYKDTYKWRRSHEDIGRIWMLGKQYKEAQARFERLAERSGSRGRRGRFLSGFADYKLNNTVSAVKKFSALIDGKRGDLDQYRYWRWKIYLSLIHI